jgi:hypothetical protein
MNCLFDSFQILVANYGEECEGKQTNTLCVSEGKHDRHIW